LHGADRDKAGDAYRACAAMAVNRLENRAQRRTQPLRKSRNRATFGAPNIQALA
jgi:hypothetical protein